MDKEGEESGTTADKLSTSQLDSNGLLRGTYVHTTAWPLRKGGSGSGSEERHQASLPESIR